MSPETSAAEAATVPGAPSSRVVKIVPLKLIEREKRFQVRIGSLDAKTIFEYEQIIHTVGHMDPLVIFRRGEKYTLASGWHRFAAYENCGKPTAPCEIRDGDDSEVLACAIRSNAKHGLRMTQADKRRAGDLAVTDPVLGQLSDAKIAHMLGVSTSFINICRRGIKPEAKAPREKKKPDPPPAAPVPSKQEIESPAPPAARARERQNADPRPTKATFLRQIQQHLDLDVVEEDDIIKLFETPGEQYVWLTKPGSPVKLRIINRTGRVLLEADMILKGAGLNEVVVKAEGIKEITAVES